MAAPPPPGMSLAPGLKPKKKYHQGVKTKRLNWVKIPPHKVSLHLPIRAALYFPFTFPREFIAFFLYS
jgi:hypothetical protein